jgi:transcriptional regulator with XRE-family HTH domain
MSWLARRTDKSPSYVLRVINGQRRASKDFRLAAALALGVPETMLFPELGGDTLREQAS